MLEIRSAVQFVLEIFVVLAVVQRLVSAGSARVQMSDVVEELLSASDIFVISLVSPERIVK